jgi:hypothetical protein
MRKLRRTRRLSALSALAVVATLALAVPAELGGFASPVLGHPRRRADGR